MMDELIDRLKPVVRRSALLRDLSEQDMAQRYHDFQLRRMRLERRAAALIPGRIRVAATACWAFPIYSQTFVYQELVQVMRGGFDLRFLYSSLNPRSHLPAQFSSLWNAKRMLVLEPNVFQRDFGYFQEKCPEKIQSLTDLLCRASGLSREELHNHYHFRQSFSFARMVEAYSPDYLHSYFFYEGTLFTFVASHLLGIPRGVSCYADHALQDYALKAVPLHLDQCSIVIATSHRIKQELIGIHPQVDTGKIVVKPNAIACKRFPASDRSEPAAGDPFRLVCVNRIEPKKGTLHLVEALRLLLDRKINVSVHLLGGVDDSEASQQYAQSVEQRIRELHLENTFHLEGRRSETEIREFLQTGHLFIAPFVETDTGDKDGIPTALLEAMATGIPAVATDAGSILEVIDDQKDGVIVPQKDATQLAGAIEALLQNPERRRELGRAGAAKIRREYDVAVCEPRFHERIRKVVAGRRMVG